MLTDRLTESRISDALDEHLAPGLSGRTVDVSVESGHAVLTGTSFGRPDFEAVEAIVRDVKGVSSVESKIVHVDPPYMG